MTSPTTCDRINSLGRSKDKSFSLKITNITITTNVAKRQKAIFDILKMTKFTFLFTSNNVKYAFLFTFR